jgi:hypothetical protein
MTKPPSKPPSAAKGPGMPDLDAYRKPPSAGKPGTAPHKPKTFSVGAWTDSGQGEKIVLYAPSGMGKTTLASMAPNPVFIGLDDGGRKIRNPKTGEPVRAVMGIETFRDLRDAFGQADLFPAGSTAVIDTFTKAEVLGEQYTFETVKMKDGPVKSLEDYGYGKGYRFLMETMRLLLADLDPLVRRGVNVLLLCQQGQATVANLEGTDYLMDAPKLHVDKKGVGVCAEVCEWADHIFRIGHSNIAVTKTDQKATKGKVSGTTDKVIFTAKELHFLAKSRPINGNNLPPIISFDNKADDSLWQYIFHGAVAPQEA